jgi:hypothetical protein
MDHHGRDVRFVLKADIAARQKEKGIALVCGPTRDA